MFTNPLDRRQFVVGAAGMAGSLALAGLGARAASETAVVARRLFFDNPDCINVRVSPDGTQVAYVAPLDGVLNLWQAPLDMPASRRPVTRVTARSISSWFQWAHTNRHLVYFEEQDGDENWRGSSVDIATGVVVPLTPPRGVRSFHQESDYRFPDEMLFRHNQRDKRFFDLYRINVVTGAATLEYENHDYIGLITDSTFRLRLSLRFAEDGSAEYFERQPDGGWQPFMTVPISDIDSTRMLDFSDDGRTLYMLDARGRDKAALVALDMATRRATVLAEDNEADITRVEFDAKTRLPLAALAVRDRMRWHVIDPTIREELAALAKYGDGDIEFVSRSQDGRKTTVYFERDTASGEYAVVDHGAKTVRRLMRQRPMLDHMSLRPMRPVVFPSRDGLRLNGYLTLPDPAAGDTNLPLVLVIHGGPYLRDRWGFSGTHQWLASRGYAVLSINYRGSTGYGKAFVTAADREWGGRMHDDLIDGVDWAVRQGLADPKRVGFYGGSYGGYSALQALTKTPDVFACIVDIFGISNLITFMATIPPYWGPWFSIWKNRLGDPKTDEGRAFLLERSPITHIDRAVKPILIAQGMRDVRVVAAESEQMVAALTRKGVPVTYVTFPDEGHGFVKPANRMAFFAITEAFLARHLGGRRQSIGDDLAGSSLKIETGGELVPGLVK